MDRADVDAVDLGRAAASYGLDGNRPELVVLVVCDPAPFSDGRFSYADLSCLTWRTWLSHSNPTKFSGFRQTFRYKTKSLPETSILVKA